MGAGGIVPKGENAILTARRRAGGSTFAHGMGQKTVLLDPFKIASTPRDNLSDLRGTFNPLDMLSIDNSESVDQAARIADSIIDSDSSTASDPFWNEAARSLIKGVELHVATSPEYEPDERNLITVRDLIMEGYAELKAMLDANMEDDGAPSAYALLFRAMTKNEAFEGEIAKNGRRFARMEQNGMRTLESVAQVACTSMDFLGSEAMQSLVRTSSFSISELKDNPRGMSLFLCLPQRFMSTHFRFLRMMISLINAEIDRQQYRPRSGHNVLMILDEFAALKRMQDLEIAAAQSAGKGMTMMFIAQTTQQLKDIYKENWETLLDNCVAKICFSNSGTTADYISKLCGDVESVRETSSHNQSHGSSSSNAFGETQGGSDNNTSGTSASWSSGKSGWSVSGSMSSSQTQGSTYSRSATNTLGHNQSATTGVSETIHKRPLIAPYEVSKFFSDPDNPMSLVLTRGQNPLSVRRIAYYQETMFAEMFDPHPDHPMPPTREQLEARAAEARQQIERQRLYGQQQKQAALRKRQEETKHANARYFEARAENYRQKQREAQARCDAAQAAFNEDILPDIIKGAVFMILLVIAIIVF